MTKPRSIDEIYKEVGTLTFKGHHYVRRRNLKKQLKQLLLSEMPKPKELEEYPEYPDFDGMHDQGYNQALSDMREVINDLL